MNGTILYMRVLSPATAASALGIGCQLLKSGSSDMISKSTATIKSFVDITCCHVAQLTGKVMLQLALEQVRNIRTWIS